VLHGAGEQAASSAKAGCEARPWRYWPDHEDLSHDLVRLLAAAQDGGSAVAECLRTAGRIDPCDEDSWYLEWKQTADASHERGNRALQLGHGRTAQSNWLRAISYYQAAAQYLDGSDTRCQLIVSRMRSCARHYLDHLTPQGDVIEIAWLDQHPLQGYFLPPPDRNGQVPVVICIGEPGCRKEELLARNANHARDRGMALLAVDLLGTGNTDAFQQIVGRADLEHAIPAIIDHVVARPDIDSKRIAIIGDAWGSSFVARGIARDRRLAAAVCDGGLWDLHERDFLMRRLRAHDAGMAATARRSGLARLIECPVLVTLGEQGWLDKDHVGVMFDQLRASHGDIELRMFSSAETASAQGHADNPTLANEIIFDWIADRLAGAAQDCLPRRAQG
jgi:dienelactone hydrolase